MAEAPVDVDEAVDDLGAATTEEFRDDPFLRDYSAREMSASALSRIAAGGGGPGGPVDAEDVTFTPTGTIAATDVQAAIAEVATEAASPNIARVVELPVSDPNGDAVTTGDGKAHFFVPALLNGMNLVAAHAGVTTVSSSGTPTVQVHNLTQTADMLSTRITIDASEKTSYTAAAAPVIDTGNDDVATGDQLRIDVDVAGTGTKGLCVILTFQTP